VCNKLPHRVPGYQTHTHNGDHTGRHRVSMTDVNAARVEELIFENWLVKKKR
jgi:hypothetical protein